MPLRFLSGTWMCGLRGWHTPSGWIRIEQEDVDEAIIRLRMHPLIVAEIMGPYDWNRHEVAPSYQYSIKLPNTTKVVIALQYGESKRLEVQGRYLYLLDKKETQHG